MGVLEDKLQLVKSARTVHTFTLPDSVLGEVRSVGLVELTAEEELMATKRARGDHFRLAYELAKQALATVNGARVGVADGSADAAWQGMHPKVRNMVLAAYMQLHTPDEGSTADFLKTVTVQVG
jgi:hypothetical protein